MRWSGRRTFAVAAAVAAAVLLGLAACKGSSSDRPLLPPVPDKQGPDEVVAELKTSLGTIRCTIHPSRVPRAAALFMGLAKGGVPWKAPNGKTTSRPLYRDLIFHRRLAGTLVQSGCPLHTGMGHPGYRIPIETSDRDQEILSHAGSLILASYTPPPFRDDPNPPPPGDVLGSQFAIGLAAMDHLVDKVTVLGVCENLDVITAISEVPQAAAPPRLEAIEILQKTR